VSLGPDSSISQPPDAAGYRLGFDMSTLLGFGERPAVLIVDVQKYATAPESPLYAECVVATLPALQELIAAGRAGGAPIIYAVNVFEPDQVDLECAVHLRKFPAYKLFVRGLPWVEIADEIRPQPGDIVVEKQMASAFFQTNLPRLLTTLKVDTLLIGGFTTSGCVRATVTDALFHGYVPILPIECQSDRSPSGQQQNLFDMHLRYADVLPLATVTAYLAHVGVSSLAKCVSS
jgi:maleamate amidohydrolase